MHTHKINSTSQEHQSFLAQNRKDPITGDSILEGDEVVFCASCKSVFLIDTWEYLGKQHCEQFETLVEFPSNFANITINKAESILFYNYLPPQGHKKGNYIPSGLNRNTWEYKKGELNNHEYNFYQTPLFYGLISSSFIGGIAACALLQGFYPIIGSIIFSIIVFFIGVQEVNEQGQQLKTIYGEFRDNTFYISKTGIGFSSAYGIKEFILQTESIRSLEFHFSYSYFGTTYCVIYDVNGNRTRFLITNFLEENRDDFLEALAILNKEKNISIEIQIDDSSLMYNTLNYEVTQNNYNILVSRK